MSRWGGNKDAMKRSRARDGAAASAASPKRYAPLREVTASGLGCETLECGHEIRTPRDLIGETAAFRRRCLDCLIETCTKAGHPFDIDRGNVPTCRCGESDSALSHLLGWHGQDVDELRMRAADLSEARSLHEALHEGRERVAERGGLDPENGNFVWAAREHYHWQQGGEWQVRTRPEHLAGGRR
jgi:hypothetical protein